MTTVIQAAQPALAGKAENRSRRGWFSIPGMRWAAAALALFLVGLMVQLTGGPEWAWWGLYLACYATGGSEPALANLAIAATFIAVLVVWDLFGTLPLPVGGAWG